MPLMKARVLESELQQLGGFESRSVRLEQYETRPHIAAHALLTAASHGAIEDALVLDACCGPGVLGAGAALLGAGAVLCADIDPAALAVLADNRARLQERHPEAAAAVTPLLADLLHSDAFRWEGVFDTVLMNPPFGTKHNAGVDMRLLQVAIHAAHSHVFSFHKTSTREHIRRRAREWGAGGEVVAELRFDLPKSLRFHKQSSVDIAVDLWHFTRE